MNFKEVESCKNDGVAQRIFKAVKLFLVIHVSIMIDACYYTFLKTHSMNNKSDPNINY